MFGDDLATVPVTSVGGNLGETLGASGVIQLTTFIEAASSGRLPGIDGVSEALDQDLPTMRVADSPIEGQFKKALLLSLGFDGCSAASVVSAPS